MDLHDQGEVHGFSPAYDATAAHAFSQFNFSDTKVHEDHGASQPLVTGSATDVDKKAMAHIELVVRPKPENDLPEDGLPAYSGRMKGLAIRQRKGAHNKNTSTFPQKLLRQSRAKSKIRSHAVPTKLLLIPREPTAGHPYLFHARIKLDEALQVELESGVYDPGKLFLTQPIATGVWYGAHLVVEAIKGHKKQYHHFYNKVTWGEFLTILFNMHPTGSFRDLRHGEKDFFPEEDWEFYEVQVSLLMGAPVE